MFSRRSAVYLNTHARPNVPFQGTETDKARDDWLFEVVSLHAVMIRVPFKYLQPINIHIIRIQNLNKPAAQSCAVAKSETFWRDTGQSNLAERT